MSEKREFAVGAVFHLMVTIITVISGYAIHLWVARSLGPASYGVFGVVMALYHIIVPFVQASFPKAASKFIAESVENIGGVFKTTFLNQFFWIIPAFLLFLFSGYFSSYFFHDITLQPYITFLAFIIPLLSLSFCYLEGYLNGLRKFKQEAYGKMLLVLLRTFLIFLFVFLGMGVLGILRGYLISLIISLFISVLLFGTPRIRNVPSFSSRILRRFAFYTALSAIGLLFLRNLDILLVKSIMVDDVQVGYYGAASTLASVPYILFSSLGVVLLPSISKSVYEKNAPLTMKYITQSLRYVLLLFIPITAITFVVSSGLVTLIYSPTFLAAAPSLSILIFSSLFLVLFMILLTTISASNRPLISTMISLFGALILYVASKIIIPLYGFRGAAYASLIASAVSLLIAGWYVYFRFGNFVSITSVVRMILCSSMIGIIAYIWQPTGFMVLISYVLLFLFYVLLLYLFGELQQQDIQLLKDVGKKFLRKA